MLTSLTIRDVVLIEALTIDFDSGLGVLTGETGAGKSILLDSLGLVLGLRADASLVRAGAPQASVTASFEVSESHPARVLVRESGLEDGASLLLRRVVKADGGSRAFINDQPVGVALLRDIGEQLVEIHGQHDERGLLNPRGHRALLDIFGRLQPLCEQAAQAYAHLVEARQNLEAARSALADAERDREWLQHAVTELGHLKPEPGEEQALADERSMMQKGQRLAGDLDLVMEALTGEAGLSALRQAARRLERMSGEDSGLDEALQALDRAVDAAMAAEDLLLRARASMAFDPARLESVETRLFDLRAMARKYKVSVDELPVYAQGLAEKLTQLEAGEGGVAALEAKVPVALQRFGTAAQALSSARHGAAQRLDAAVAAELKPLKLDAARFETVVETLPEEGWGASGADRVEFMIATNPGAKVGPLTRIASGGELSRFILALKVALAGTGSASTLIFDEIDRGVGGAVASAIGERLSSLGKDVQVLAVTHSPQVAASADRQWVIAKSVNGGAARTTVTLLDEQNRREEIARMLSGDQVTEEARAQAGRLMGV